VVVIALCVRAVTSPQASGPAQSSPELSALPLEPPTLADAHSLFYNARYEAAAALTLALRVSDTEDLASDELRSSALLFQLKALLEGRPDKEDALRNCATCPDLIAEFFAAIHRGQNLARTTLRSNPGDEAALFFLGKLDLNYVWLQLGPLRRKTGWTSTGKRDGPSTRCSHTIRGTFVRESHAPGSINRRHQNALGHPLAAGRRQQEASSHRRA
jgi:hypothetical protein